MKKLFIIFILSIFMTNLLHAEFYWLRNINSKSSTNLSNSDLYSVESVLNSKVVFEDSLIINGYSTKMEVGNSQHNFGEILNLLSSIDYKIINIIDQNTILIDVKLNDNTKKVFLVCNILKNSKAVVFSIELPLKVAKYLSTNNWNNIIRSGDIQYVIEYPKRKAFYITFKNVFNPLFDMQYASEYLKSQGFTAISNDFNDINNLSEIFINNKTNEVICISFNRENESGFIYQKRTK